MRNEPEARTHSVGTRCGSAMTVLFLLLFATAVGPNQRSATMSVRAAERVASIDLCAFESRAVPGAFTLLEAPESRAAISRGSEPPRFLRIDSAGLPGPRAP